MKIVAAQALGFLKMTFLHPIHFLRAIRSPFFALGFFLSIYTALATTPIPHPSPSGSASADPSISESSTANAPNPAPTSPPAHPPPSPKSSLTSDSSDLKPADFPSPASPTPSPERQPFFSQDNHHTLRSKALELAGAFSNDGYKIRDSFWLSMSPPIGQASFLAVNLFAGNQYWFCVAATPPSRIVLKLYNENGELIATQPYENDSTAALGAEPVTSGKHYLSVQLSEGNPVNFCILYTYK